MLWTRFEAARRSVVPLLFILISSALLLSGCDDETGESSEAAQTAGPLQVSIGIVQSLTGAGAVYGESVVAGIELAIEELNADTTQPRLHFDYTVMDDGSTADGAEAAFAEFVSQEVTALIGPTLTAAAAGGHRLAQDASIPVLSPTTTSVTITATGDYIFRIALAEDTMVPAVIQYVADEQSLSRAVLIVDSTDAFSNLSSDAMHKGIAAAGATIVREIDLAQTPLSEAVANLAGVEFDAFLITPLVARSAEVLQAVRGAGFEQLVIGGNSFNTLDIARLAGDAVEGAFVGAAWNPGLSAATSQRFVEAYTEMHGRAPDQFAAQGYSAIYLLADAIRRAGSTDRQAIRDALAATSEVETPLGMVSMSKERNAEHAPVIQHYRNGQLVVVE